MFRYATLAILMVGAVMVIAGPITQDCTKYTETNGDVTVTCRDIPGIIVTWPNGRVVVLNNWAELSNYHGWSEVRSGNSISYTYTP